MNLRKPPKMTSFIGNLLRLLLSCWVAMAIAGCAGNPKQSISAHMQADIDSKPKPLQPLYQKLYLEGKRNQVLNGMQIGLAAMELKEFDLAHRIFEDVVGQIELVYAETESAANARSLWFEEGAKDFKGEPYERAMAYYYLGLLDMWKGDY